MLKWQKPCLNCGAKQGLLRKTASLAAAGLSDIICAAVEAFRYVRPLLGPKSCRFVPPCMDYTQQSVKKHGPVKGAVIAARRICSCHPFHPGGWDPVP